ncbi:MAG: hypothetical protein ABIB71_04785 [Candidatus Woesearchaeota archaeon]
MSLISWLFGRSDSSNKRVEKVERDVKNSLGAVRKDIHNVSKWLVHFKEKHQQHDKNFDAILARLDCIEERLIEISEIDAGDETSLEEENSAEVEELHGEEPKEDSNWELLTDTQKNICWKLASIQKENPDQWVSLKYLAQEIYPDKDYTKVRSALSQFVSQLEELGYVKRKRRGKQAYVYSTKNNPYYKAKKKPLIAKVKVKSK